MAPKAIVAIYASPGAPLPTLAVVIHPDGIVSGGAAKSDTQAQTMATALASELHLEIVNAVGFRTPVSIADQAPNQAAVLILIRGQLALLLHSTRHA